MSILVTGAGGFLGKYIAKLLIEQGHHVVNFSRNSYPELEELGVENRTGDLQDLASIDNALEGITGIFHVAGKVAMWGKWEDFYNVNTVGTMNLIKCAKRRGISKFVYTSTPSVVFGKEEIHGENETLNYPKEYLSLYAKSKMMAEKYVLESNSENFYTCALRPHLIFGPGDQNIIPRLLDAAQKNKLKIVGDGENLVDIIYVENAAKAHVQAFDKLGSGSKVCGQAYFIAQEKPVKLWSFINTILEKKAIAPVKKKISLRKAYFIGSVIEFILRSFRIWNVHPPMSRFVALQLSKSHYFSHGKALEHFDYSPEVSIEQAIDRTIASL
ncbi:NAD-dependent epimerase/dehydratase family protein [Halobacteriovorax sp. HLS]|uniref:NAD-dependent epimerase/dehydratase family protein n=1 Tax=Halobacteriovorax sp. HLS TaxID=2234000 RepID=UPI000FDB4680|nr:NAD-dependent epimerase/dehydratase family protein [Halobacteriovorax sp. HLS]